LRYCIRLAVIVLSCFNPAYSWALPVETGGQGRVQVSIKSLKDIRDENVVRQAFDYSCGAAALATLLSYGMNDPTSELEVLEGMLRGLALDEEAAREKEGFSLLDLQRAAHEKGYHAEGFRVPPEALYQITGPVIVFITPRGYEHFAVLRGVRGNRAYLADPALGNVRRADYDFFDMWLGEDGMGIVFALQPKAGGLPASVPLALNDNGAPRPELLSARQLQQVGPASLPQRGLR
jgi:uncharacterized protein